MSGKVLHINEIKLPGEDPWAKAFNRCSDLFALFMDETRTEEEREQSFQDWRQERYKLEMGII